MARPKVNGGAIYGNEEGVMAFGGGGRGPGGGGGNLGVLTSSDCGTGLLGEFTWRANTVGVVWL